MTAPEAPINEQIKNKNHVNHDNKNCKAQLRNDRREVIETTKQKHWASNKIKNNK